MASTLPTGNAAQAHSTDMSNDTIPQLRGSIGESVSSTSTLPRISEGDRSEQGVAVKKGFFRTMFPLRTNASTSASCHAQPAISEPKLNLLRFFMCAWPTFGGILFGYDSGYISGILGMKQFKQDFAYTSSQKSLIVSLLSAGTFVGSLLSAGISDRIGRKNTLNIGCVVFIIGVVLQDAASSVGLLVAGRAVAGLGVGFVSSMVILYVGEICPSSIRGAVVSGYQFNITIGLLIAAGVDDGTKDRTDSGAYRIPIGIQFAWALILMGGLCPIPESPRWYVRKERFLEAGAAIAKLRGIDENSGYVQQELKMLRDNCDEEYGKLGSKPTGWLDCFKGGWTPGSNLRKTLLAMTLQAFQQLTGVNFIFYFGTTFLEQAQIKNPFIISLITAAVNVASTPISFWAIERLGRRPLLIWGAVAMAICHMIIAIVGTAVPHSDAVHKLLVFFICLFIFFFAWTWGPTGWVVSSELFPLTIRSKSIGLATASNWLFNFALSFSTPYLVDKDKANLGTKVFFIWGSCCVGAAIFAYFFIPETKGLKLEEVDAMMASCAPRKSASWKSGEANARGVLEKEDEEMVTTTASHLSMNASTLRAE